LKEEKKDVYTVTSTEGKTSFMVCNTKEGKNEKVCRDVESATKSSEKTESSNQAVREKGLTDNNTYNLMEQLTTENKSLWRIKNYYKNDAKMDNESKQLWNFIEKDKEEVVKLLTEKLKERI
jgi:hypothetical protein